MPVPEWVPGQLLNASDVNAWMVPNGSYKIGATTRSHFTLPAADPDLLITFPQGGSWVIEAFIRFHGPASNNLFWTWQTSATSISGGVAAIFNNNSGSLEVSWRLWTFASSLAQTTGSGVEWTIRFNGFATVPTGVSSSLAFAWAQGTDSATVTSVDTGSYLLGWRAN